LWFDKFLSSQANEGEAQPKTELVREVAGIPSPELYKAFYTRWKSQLQASGASVREAVASGRLSVGLGSESVIETSISFHRTYGVPVIPGSALKGLASAYAHQQLEGDEWRKATKDSPQGAAHRTIFGSSADNDAEAGFVTFFDALWIPGSGAIEGRPFAPDVMSVHHAEYYRGDNVPPADWDSPTVVSFLTATGSFLIALAGPDEWVDAAFEILGLALADYGVGAKTSSGYGRMKLAPKPVDPDFEKAEFIISKVNALKPNDVPTQLGQAISGWKDLRDGSSFKLKAAKVIVEKGSSWKGAKGKEWFQAILQYIETNEGK
jgi:CRISPR-associated protein Cmr6